jgi:hypothetical protein
MVMVEEVLLDLYISSILLTSNDGQQNDKKSMLKLMAIKIIAKIGLKYPPSQHDHNSGFRIFISFQYTAK